MLRTCFVAGLHKESSVSLPFTTWVAKGKPNGSKLANIILSKVRTMVKAQTFLKYAIFNWFDMATSRCSI